MTSLSQERREESSSNGREFLSSGTGMASYPGSSTFTSTSLGHRHPGGESGSSSLDWLSSYTRPSGDDPSEVYSSSASSNFANDVDYRFSASSERNRAMPSIPGLGGFDHPVPDKPVAPKESSQPKYTSDSSSDVLLHLGLEKEDLYYLISYPEDQITPANLPLILRQIRFEKAKRSTTAVPPKPCLGPQPSRGSSGTDSHSLSSSGGARMQKEEIPPPVLKSSTRHGRELLPENIPELKSSALDSSRDQASSVSSLSSSYSSSSVIPPSSDPTKRLQTVPNQTFQSILSLFSLPKEDTDIRVFNSETPKPVPLGLVVIDSNDTSGTTNESKPPGRESTVAGSYSIVNLAAQPTEAMMNDCAGITPRTFPHTCCLCNKISTHMKNWLSHRNSSLHLESCRLLLKQYPVWGRDTACAAGQDVKPSQHHQNSRHGRSRSRSPQRRTPPTEKSHSPLRRSDPRKASPRRSEKRRMPPKRSENSLSPSRRSDRSRSPLRRNDESRLPPWESDPSPRSPQQKSSNTTESLVKKHLETSVPPAVQSLSAKMDSSKSPSSSSSSAASPSVISPTAKSCEAKSDASSSTKLKSGKPPPPSMVKLEGILDSLSRADVFAAVEHFGKTKSLLLFRSKQEAVVFFEREEDAEKLRNVKIFRVKEVTLTVREKEADSQQPHEKPSTVVSTPQTTAIRNLPLTPNKPPVKSPSSVSDEDSGPVEVEEVGAGTRAEDQEEKPATADVKAGNSVDECRESGALNSPADPSMEAPALIQQRTSPEPGGPETRTRTKTSLTDEICQKQSLSGQKKLLLITNLPKFVDGCYSEDDLSELLSPFGFQHSDDSIHVVPQTCMAFVSMPSLESLHRVTSASAKDGIIFKGSKLVFQELANDITTTPLLFYKSLMELIRFIVVNDGERIILIKNISWSESKQLRATLEKIGSVKNFLPLLNKVFVEFVSVRDADRLGVWYSFLKRVPGHEVHRLKVPYRACTSLPPSLPENALPDGDDAVTGATIPPTGVAVPPGSVAPFWVTMTTRPFLFPTMSPWFIIPDFLTVTRKGRPEAILSKVMSSTVMLTGLPEGNYKHEDVARLVWNYFPKQNLHSLYYNLTVLTLQRRAFVFFPDWTTCCSFIQDHMKKTVCVKGCPLSVHLVLKHMSPESSEEMMYSTMMKLSNAGVPEPESLEERLLCVEISETSLDVIKAVMEVVASVAAFVGFLPLANRICIQMTESRGVAKVVEQHHADPQLWKTHVWSKVRHVESVKSLKKRLQDSDEMTVDLV